MHPGLEELRRLDILRRYDILDTPPEPVFDRLLWLATEHFHAPMGVLTFVDENRQWFKAVHGLGIRETPRAIAFCDHTIRQRDVFEVPDSCLDPRFANNPLVTCDPFIRYYAGAPLITSEGWVLGSLAVLDHHPRTPLDPSARHYLAELAAMVVSELEIRLAAGDVRAEITERRRVEVELRLAGERSRQALAAAERANGAKTRFLAAASHDLRQPIQSLTLFLEILRRRLKGHPAAPVAASAAAACNSLRGLLDGLLDISRLEAGLVRPTTMAFALDGLLDRLVAEYRPRARAKGLTLRHQPTCLAVVSDPALLERVLRNLMENALRYTAKGGILVGCRRRGDQVAVVVADTGPGMREEETRTIFEEFVQLDNPERDRSKGLGLGLAIVRRLGELLGARVEVRSRLGHGSAFSIALPRADRPVPAACEHNAAGAHRLTGRLVVIDDERSVRDALGLTLSDWGLDVVTAESADEALSGLNQSAPDAILADYRLRGGATGVEAARLLRNHYHRAIPTLLLTGDTSPDRLAEAVSSGFVLLHKPVAADELRRRVEDVLPHG